MLRKKQNFVVKAASVIAAVAVTKQHWKKKKIFKRLRMGNLARDRETVQQEIDQLPHNVFKQMFRIDRTTFEEILRKIEPFVEAPTNESMSRRQVSGCRGSLISTRMKLYCALRFLAGGSYLDICFGFKVGFGSFFADSKYGIVWPILEAIDKAYQIYLDMDNQEEMQKLAEEFAAIDRNSADVFNGVVMAVDGWVLETRQPYKGEVRNVMSYRNRKGVWGCVVLAGCDARTKFHIFSYRFQ